MVETAPAVSRKWLPVTDDDRLKGVVKYAKKNNCMDLGKEYKHIYRLSFTKMKLNQEWKKTAQQNHKQLENCY